MCFILVCNKIFLYLCVQILLNIKRSEDMRTANKAEKVKELQALVDNLKKPKLDFKSDEEERRYFARLAFKHRVTDPKLAF